jgi:hypothetical protein
MSRRRSQIDAETNLHAARVAARPARRGRAGRRRRRDEPPRESWVYDGGRLLGEIKPTAGAFVARDARGKKIGAFPDPRSAMREICRVARAAAAEALASA